MTFCVEMRGETAGMKPDVPIMSTEHACRIIRLRVLSDLFSQFESTL